jgi:hypothetical protein
MTAKTAAVQLQKTMYLIDFGIKLPNSSVTEIEP